MAKFGSFMGKPGVPRVRVRLYPMHCTFSKGQQTHRPQSVSDPSLVCSTRTSVAPWLLCAVRPPSRGFIPPGEHSTL